MITDRPMYNAAVLRGDVPAPRVLIKSILGESTLKKEEIIQQMVTRMCRRYRNNHTEWNGRRRDSNPS